MGATASPVQATSFGIRTNLCLFVTALSGPVLGGGCDENAEGV
jgi:hypothetical protein